MNNTHTRIVLTEKINPALNLEYRLHELIYEYFLNQNGERNAKAIIMHPETLYELLSAPCPEVQFGNGHSYWYAGIRVIRSYDMELGAFLIA